MEPVGPIGRKRYHFASKNSDPQRVGAISPHFPSAKMGPSELRRCVLLLQDFLPSFHPSAVPRRKVRSRAAAAQARLGYDH